MLRFVDLFAGIGGFHLALQKYDPAAQCLMASEIDMHAARVYRSNFLGENENILQGDITKLVPLDGPISNMVPKSFEVLTGGFPCQPFSKSGSQLGINESRGTLFYHIARILEQRKPKIVFLENVRNLVGPKHFENTWIPIVKLLRELGYNVSSQPTIMSPHLLSPTSGGAPQIRDRVFIFGVYVGKKEANRLGASNNFKIDYEFEKGWSGESWNFKKHVFEKNSLLDQTSYKISDERKLALDIWSDFLQTVGDYQDDRVLPGFPIWEQYLRRAPKIEADFPEWKKAFIVKNINFYKQNSPEIDAWRSRNPALSKLPLSYRKFEWQAGSTAELADCIVQFRPSGLRVKRATYFPALVAMAQTPFVPSVDRTLTVEEAAKLQGFPPKFNFGGQSTQLSFKQLGNAVNVGVVSYVFGKFCEHYKVTF